MFSVIYLESKWGGDVNMIKVYFLIKIYICIQIILSGEYVCGPWSVPMTVWSLCYLTDYVGCVI